MSCGTDALVFSQESCECEVLADGAAAETTASRVSRHVPRLVGPIDMIVPDDGVAFGPGRAAASR